jgi:hypothetical protein
MPSVVPYLAAVVMVCSAVGCASNTANTAHSLTFRWVDSPPFNITADKVPDPKAIPFSTPEERSAYLAFYKKAYVFIANATNPATSTSCCLEAVPYRTAKVKGHYAGQLDAQRARGAGGKYEEVK